MDELTDAEKRALSTALKFRIPQLVRIRDNGAGVRSEVSSQIAALISAAQKLHLP